MRRVIPRVSIFVHTLYGWMFWDLCFILFFKVIFNWRIIALQCCIFSTIHQHESAIGIHMAPPSWTSVPPPIPHHPPSRLSQGTWLSTLPHTTNFHWLSILQLVIYMFQCYSLNSSHPLNPPLCPQACNLSLVVTLQIGSSVPFF